MFIRRLEDEDNITTILSMQIKKTALEGVFIIELDVFRDERGEFFEAFQKKRYEELGIPPFVQDNLSLSKKGVLRGLHYQTPPFGQGKMLQVLKGRALDVAVDIRFGSPMFGRHIAAELSGENHRQLFIPAGFAHGFLALDDDTIFQYKCTNVYSREHERGILWNDPALSIGWDIDNPLVSDKDKALPLLKDIVKDYYFQ